jgi:signal transduction histidine kinase
VPLGIALERRARSELERANLVRAEAIAQSIGGENLTPARRDALRTIVRQAAHQLSGRVIVVDAQGGLIADSQGAALGQPYATPGRPEIVAALQNRPTSEVRYSHDLGRNVMATAVPVVDESITGVPSVIGAVRITESMDQLNADVRGVIIGLIAIGIAALVAGSILAFLLARSMSRPLKRLATAAKRLGEGDLSVRAGELPGPTEIEGLARSFDGMAERLERTVRAQREFVANASHQLRTPLTGLKLRIGAARAEGRDEERTSELAAADVEVDRLARIVERLLLITRRIERGESPDVDLDAAAERALARWTDRAGAEIDLTGSPATARADPTDVDQILDNLVDNAITHAPGPIEISTGARARVAWLAVRDHGAGIPATDTAHVTERFYRGAGAPSGGSGLGLAIVRELTERAGGTVTISSARDGGTIVRVELPASEIGAGRRIESLTVR